MAASSVPKLYRAVMEDVLNNVREAFLDEGVDEQVLHELKQHWEKKINETKAVDNNAREPDPMPMAKQSNRSNANSSHSRNSQPNKEPPQPPAQPQPQPQSQPVAQQVQQPVNHVTNTHIQSVANHQVAGALPQMHLQPSNVVLGPSGINYTTGADNQSDAQRNAQANSAAPKLVFLQGPNGHQLLVNPGLNLTPDILNHFANFQNSQANILQNQATVVQHTNNVSLNPNQTIQFAPASQINARPAAPQPQQPSNNRVVQLDGAHDTSDEDEDEDEYRDNDDDHEDNDDEVNDDENDGQGEDEEPLNSEDDVSDEDPTELFETDNVVVCQYDKITRSRNKWKFHLKDGIMNLQGKDYVFQKAVGDAEW